MALPYFSNKLDKQRDRFLAIDLGTRITKAVQVQRRDGVYALCGYALLDAPIYEKTMSAELLAEHLKAVGNALEAKTKYLTLTVGVNDALVRQAEMPVMPMDDMRTVLKLNSKTYVQQELVNHVFDCHLLLPKDGAGQPSKTGSGVQKQKVLLAGARKQLVNDFVEGGRSAGFIVDQIVPGLIGPVNAFEQAMPQAFATENVAIVDIGFKNTSICILQKGELALSRVVAIGGDRLTSGLSELMKVSYAEAEGIKVGMPTEVETQLETLLLPLGRELRASIDFFEHQNDCAVGSAFITGGSARSEFIVQRLQQELMIECKILNPAAQLRMELNPQQVSEIEQVAPQLTVAVGAALAGF